MESEIETIKETDNNAMFDIDSNEELANNKSIFDNWPIIEGGGSAMFSTPNKDNMNVATIVTPIVTPNNDISLKQHNMFQRLAAAANCDVVKWVITYAKMHGHM